MRLTYKSKAMAAVHESMEDLYEAGAIDKQTMRKFDAMCLTPVREFTAEDIQKLRAREGLSQPVFARYLNVTKSLVSQWERGEKHPRGASLKLLALIERKGLEAVA
jgi:putative transcriptional regulator